MVGTDRRRIGFDAEQLAFRYLRSNGLRPVTKNFRTRRGEIDLIMLDADCLAFIEVRYRASNSYVGATYTVNARKQQKLAATASIFLAKHARFQNRTCRFDVVGVDQDRQGDVSINWLKDAFRL